MITREEINSWDGFKSRAVMLRIFDAAERDLSVNDGTIPQEEVDECTGVMNMMREDITKHEDALREETGNRHEH